MSAFWGYVWLAMCILFAGCLWMVNVIFIDNAIPAILDPLQAAFDTPIVDTFDNATLFMVLARWSPLLLVLIGLIGWYLECTIWGRSDQYAR